MRWGWWRCGCEACFPSNSSCSAVWICFCVRNRWLSKRRVPQDQTGRFVMEICYARRCFWSELTVKNAAMRQFKKKNWFWVLLASGVLDLLNRSFFLNNSVWTWEAWPFGGTRMTNGLLRKIIETLQKWGMRNRIAQSRWLLLCLLSPWTGCDSKGKGCGERFVWDKLKLRKMLQKNVSQSDFSGFLSSEELDWLSSSIVCILRNEGFPSFRLSVSLFLCTVQKVRRSACVTFLMRNDHDWKEWFLPSSAVCVDFFLSQTFQHWWGVIVVKESRRLRLQSRKIKKSARSVAPSCLCQLCAGDPHLRNWTHSEAWCPQQATFLRSTAYVFIYTYIFYTSLSSDHKENVYRIYMSKRVVVRKTFLR